MRSFNHISLKQFNMPILVLINCESRGVGSTLGLFGWGCAAGTQEPFAYTRASSSEFCYLVLD